MVGGLARKPVAAPARPEKHKTRAQRVALHLIIGDAGLRLLYRSRAARAFTCYRVAPARGPGGLDKFHTSQTSGGAVARRARRGVAEAGRAI